MKVFSHQGCPGLLEDGSDHLSITDKQLVEEALVGPAADLGAAESVDLVAPAEQVEGLGERVLDVAKDQLGGAEDALGLVEFAIDAVVFLAGKVTGDAAGDDATGEPLAFLFELGDALAGPGDLGFRSFVLLVQFGLEPHPDGLFHSVGEADGAGVVALDGLLHGLDGQI